jgi:hypothetical protein
LQSSGGEGIEDCVAGLAGGGVEVTDGNDGVVYTSGGLATITHDGESNFAIWAYYADGRALGDKVGTTHRMMASGCSPPQHAA